MDSKNQAQLNGKQGNQPVVSVTPMGLTAAQFEQFLKEHRRATVYAAITTGKVTNMPGITPTTANLKGIKDLAEAVLELMG